MNTLDRHFTNQGASANPGEAEVDKKNYENAAKIVRRIAEVPGAFQHGISSAKEIRRRNEDARVVAVAFTLLFREDNPNFDQERFIASCGVSL